MPVVEQFYSYLCGFTGKRKNERILIRTRCLRRFRCLAPFMEKRRETVTVDCVARHRIGHGDYAVALQRKRGGIVTATIPPRRFMLAVEKYMAVAAVACKSVVYAES